MSNKEKLQKMSLGRRAAYLRRCIRVSELVAQYENDTSIRRRVFTKHIQPEMRCSYTTFNNMLNEPDPVKQLKKVNVEMQLLSEKQKVSVLDDDFFADDTED